MVDNWKHLLHRLRRPAPYGLLLRRGPVSRNWGFDRGTPVDRHFILGFLSDNAQHIRGRVLEVKDDEYTLRFGTGVAHSDVLDIDPANQRATVIADISAAPTIPDETYDCVILTQVLHLIYDLRATVAECRRILRPGGTLLVTLPALSRLSRELADTDHWRVTPVGAQRLFGDVFGSENVHVKGHGNAVLCCAFLMGVAAEEVGGRHLRRHDPLFPLVVTVRASKV